MNKYEVRMKVAFYFKGKTVKFITMIDIVEAEEIIGASKEACRIAASLRAELTNEEKGYTYGYEELVEFNDVDEISIDISAIVPFK